jgi:hypothetical protein
MAKLEQSAAATVEAVNSKKRATPVVEEVDLDEQERRRKRAERFGNSVVVRFSNLRSMIHSCLRKLDAGC